MMALDHGNEWAVAPSCWKNLYSFSLLKFQKSGARICPWRPSERVVSEMKVDLIILVALTAHHSPFLTSYNGSWSINLENTNARVREHT